MAKERDVLMANGILRDFRARIGDRHSRIHKDTMLNNLHRQRALDGLCGDCEDLRIKFRGEGRGRGVELHCQKGHIPVEMYSKIPLGQNAECPDYTLRR